MTRYEWDWNDDGVYEESSSAPTISHVFRVKRQDARLRVTDNLGATDELRIIVEGDTPDGRKVDGP